MLVKLCPSILTLLTIHQALIECAGISSDSWQDISICWCCCWMTYIRSPCFWSLMPDTHSPYSPLQNEVCCVLCTCVAVAWYRYTMRVATVTMRLLSCYWNTEPVSMWPICGSLLPYTKQPLRENMKSANCYWRYVDGKFIIAKCNDNQ